MIRTEREKLFSHKGKYLNIGITETGEPLPGVAVPWFGTGSMFNMRTPKVYLGREDLQDKEILAVLDRFQILGFYAFCGLESYDILGRFYGLEDIYLWDAKNLRDLSFMRNTPNWFMLFVEGATIPDLAPLIHPDTQSGLPRSYCLGLEDCIVEDLSALRDSRLQLHELLIRKKWSKEEDCRWRALDARIYHYCRE